MAGVSRRIHYVWLDRDLEYALEFESARERAYDVLHDEAVRRAMGNPRQSRDRTNNLTVTGLRIVVTRLCSPDFA